MAKNNNKIVLKRHAFYRAIGIPFIKLFSIFKGYKNKSHFKIKKGESYLILSNHQTDYDGVFMMLSFNKPLYSFILLTGTLYMLPLGASIITYWLAF